MDSRRSPLGTFLSALGLALALVVGLEVGLRAFGVAAERPASRLIYQQVFTPVLTSSLLPNGAEVLATADRRLPFQWVAREKPANSLRVFVFGGSASAGLGYSPNGTFARELERMLAAAYPERAVEVVNFGIVALATAQVRVLVEDAVALGQPDWVLVYAGNNEFLEVHSERFAALTRNRGAALAQAVRDTRLARLVARPKPLDPRVVEESISTRALARSDQRVAHRELMAHVELDQATENEHFDRYEHNLASMARAAGRGGARAVLTAPAVNWRWRSLEDRPGDWVEALLAAEGIESAPDERSRLEAALGLLDRRIERAAKRDLWERLHERAEVRERLGDFAGAAEDYRASLQADPHLRRAVDRMTDLAAQAAAETGAVHFDAVDFLVRRAPHGIVGFEHFYDYVHPTPQGCLDLAEGFFALIAAEEGPPADHFDLAGHRAMRRSFWHGAQQDSLDVAHFLGFADDPARLGSRDLWKADRCLDALDARIAADPHDARALAWRGNFHFFQGDGFESARADYRASLEAASLPQVEANLARLLDDRRPGR